MAINDRGKKHGLITPGQGFGNKIMEVGQEYLDLINKVHGGG